MRLKPFASRAVAASLFAAALLIGAYAWSAGAGAFRTGDGLDPRSARPLPVAEAESGESAWSGDALAQNPCNPCGKNNPCNPCGGNPCGGNPCGGGSVAASRFKQPAGVKLASGADLVARGEELWNDRTLGKSGLACSNCHIGNYAQMQPTFAKPYPHRVAMPAQQAGVDEVNAAEMVQFCMLVPMAAEPLAWDSEELASLAAYVESIQPGYRPAGGGAANPCNPCAVRNPCNPCGGRNPCNPCGG